MPTETQPSGATPAEADPLVRRLRFDAGSLSLNLLATVGRRFGKPVERLTSVDRLRDWLAGVGLATAEALDDDDLASVRAFREELHRLLRSVVLSEVPDAAVIASVNKAAGTDTRLRMTLTRERPYLRVQPPDGSPVDRALALVALDAIHLLTGPALAELEACEAPDCRMLYLARTRSRRRWCSAQHCGNRSRVAAYRARRSAERTSSRGERA